MYLGTWVLGYLGTWVLGYLGTWVLGYLGAWVLGCLGAWALGRLGAWVLGCLGAWALGCFTAVAREDLRSGGLEALSMSISVVPPGSALEPTRLFYRWQRGWPISFAQALVLVAFVTPACHAGLKLDTLCRSFMSG
jgi:hypothetical protein